MYFCFYYSPFFQVITIIFEIDTIDELRGIQILELIEYLVEWFIFLQYHRVIRVGCFFKVS